MHPAKGGSSNNTTFFSTPLTYHRECWTANQRSARNYKTLIGVLYRWTRYFDFTWYLYCPRWLENAHKMDLIKDLAKGFGQIKHCPGNLTAIQTLWQPTAAFISEYNWHLRHICINTVYRAVKQWCGHVRCTSTGRYLTWPSSSYLPYLYMRYCKCQLFKAHIDCRNVGITVFRILPSVSADRVRWVYLSSLSGQYCISLHARVGQWLTETGCPCIVVVITVVVFSEHGTWALGQVGLTANAGHIGVPNGTNALSKECKSRCTLCSSIPQLSTDYACISDIPSIIAHSAPLLIVEDLHTPFIWTNDTIHQTNSTLRI